MTARTVVVDGDPFLYGTAEEAVAAFPAHIRAAAAGDRLVEVSYLYRRVIAGHGRVRVLDMPPRRPDTGPLEPLPALTKPLA